MRFAHNRFQICAVALLTLMTTGLVSAKTAVKAAPALPDLELNSDIKISVEIKREGSPTEVEKDSDFRRALFFGKSSERYQYSMDFFESEKGLQGRFCQLSTTGSLFDCFTVTEKSNGDQRGCLISPYNTSRDFPKSKRGYTESDLNRAFKYARFTTETARRQLLQSNLGKAGAASAERFKPMVVEYIKSENVVVGAKASPSDFIRARGSVTCKRLHEVILPAYRNR